MDASFPPMSPPTFKGSFAVMLTIPVSVSTGKSTTFSKMPLLSCRMHPKMVWVASNDVAVVRVVTPNDGVRSVKIKW